MKIKDILTGRKAHLFIIILPALLLIVGCGAGGGGSTNDATDDETPPTIEITSPASENTYQTDSDRLDIGGTSEDYGSVTAVTWSNDRGGSGTCSGTVSWSAADITLSPGTNVITVTAIDAAGNPGTATLTVSYILTWERTYGGSDQDDAKSVQVTSDGGYIIAGHTISYGNGSADVYLIKIDAEGNQLWQQTYGGEYFEAAESVQVTSDGGYIIAGHTNSFGNWRTDVYLIKTDAYGNLLWQQTFGEDNSDQARSVQVTNDGGYIIAGYTESIDNVDFDVYLIKTDAAGNELWQKTFGGESYDTARSVQATSDGGYIIAAGTSSFGNGESDAYLIKTDADGNLLWQKTFGGESYDSALSVQATSDGGYIIAGLTVSFGNGGSDVYLIKTDADGNLLWQKTFGGENDDNAYSVQVTGDGGYIIAGYTTIPGSDEALDIFLIKTDADGNQLWHQTFGGENFDRAYSVQVTGDGGYIIAGYTGIFGNGESNDAYLIKTDSDGNSKLGE